MVFVGTILSVIGIVTYFGTLRILFPYQFHLNIISIFLPVITTEIFQYLPFQYILVIFIGQILFWIGLIITIVGVVKRIFPEKPFIPISLTQQNQLSEDEKAVIRFIEEHGHRIRLSECASTLGISVDKVKGIIESLEKKGTLKMKKVTNSV